MSNRSKTYHLPQAIETKRIVDSSHLHIESLNHLLDSGVVWDDAQGQLFLQDSNNALFVAYYDNQLVGFATAHRLQRFDKRKAEVLLYEIGVDEKFRNHGIGTALVAEIKNWAITVGADEIWVQTHKSNTAAVALYKSCGGEEDAQDTTMYTMAVK